jgi:hypothetical protein
MRITQNRVAEHRRRIDGSALEPSVSMPIAYAGGAFIDGQEGR